MSVRVFLRRLASSRVLVLVVLASSQHVAFAGGPKFVAGTDYFDAGVMGQPEHWAGGQVNYYVDQGPLSGTVTHEQATAMVDAAAALWSAVPTAGVKLTNKGSLNEDVNGGNSVATVRGRFAQPADGNVGNRWPGHVCAGDDARCRHESAGDRCHGRHGGAANRNSAASLRRRKRSSDCRPELKLAAIKFLRK